MEEKEKDTKLPPQPSKEVTPSTLMETTTATNEESTGNAVNLDSKIKRDGHNDQVGVLSKEKQSPETLAQTPPSESTGDTLTYSTTSSLPAAPQTTPTTVTTSKMTSNASNVTVTTTNNSPAPSLLHSLGTATATARNPTTTTSQPPIRMHLKTSRKSRKRKNPGIVPTSASKISSGYNSSGSSGGSSGGSSDEEEQHDSPYYHHMNNNNKRPRDPMNISQHYLHHQHIQAVNTASTALNDNNLHTSGSTAGGTPNSNGSGANRSLEQPKGWRVKLYRLNADGSWDDCGTGRIQCLYNQTILEAPQRDDTTDKWLYLKTGEPILCVQAELTKQNRQPRVLLRTRILLRDAYQRQGDNIITWCEPCYAPPSASPTQGGSSQQEQERAEGGVDLALSFQDNAGCLDIWRQITQVQSQAAELSSPQNSSVQRLAAAVAAQHHADLVQQDHHHHQQQQQQAVQQNQQQQGQPLSPQGSPHHPHHHNHHNSYRSGQLQQASSTEQLWAHISEDELHRGGSDGYHLMEATAAPPSLPDPPTLQNLEEVADSIAALQHVQQRESLAIWIAKDECRYLKALLELFSPAEQGLDYEKLATLAACVKTILLLNDPSIVELIVTIADLFEKICACLEYDPDLREKANHRWFLRERAKFRTVVPMEDPELVAAIHRSFRVNYLRDTLLRPTMDESSLSALTSMQTFSHGDIVKGVTVSPDKDASLADSYLMRLIRVFGNELHALCVLEWMELDAHADSQIIPDCETEDMRPDPSIVVGKSSMDGATWKQYLAPQDASMRSRRYRRRGCLSFLRELFGMVRNSLQQSDKDDFFAVVCGFRVELGDDISDNVSQNSQLVEVGSVASTVRSERLGTDASSQSEFPPPSSPVTLLSLLGSILCDPNTDLTEKGSALEIIGTVAMHDASLIRRHCLEQYTEKKRSGVDEVFVGRPEPNEHKQVVFQCPHNDLLAALIFLMDTAVDAGILLQLSEIMRLLLDTDMMGDQGPPNAGFADEAEGIAPHVTHGADHPNPPSAAASLQNQNGAITTTDQKQFLSMFYESYVEWLVAPFQFQLFQCVRRVPTYVLRNPQESVVMEKIMATFRAGVRSEDPFLRPVPASALRSSFAVELLSFCVRAHLYRMKFFLLKSRVLGSVLDLLRRPTDRCLKLAALRFLRAILSVNDEFYHRHIIQNDLFDPVFVAFRANPVGDNLVSSAIVEMCDYITTEGIKSLLEYIVTKHLSVVPSTQEAIPSLEDVSSPYVSTLTVLRKAYESHLHQQQEQHQQQQLQEENPSERSPAEQEGCVEVNPLGSRFFKSGSNANLTGEALEDQRKFQQVDAEASYFESGGEVSMNEDLLHRTPRMFSFPTQPDHVASPSGEVETTESSLPDGSEEKESTLSTS